MGAALHQQQPDGGDVVYEPTNLTEQDRINADKSQHKPLQGYAYLAERRPKMFPQVEISLKQIKKFNIRVPLVRGEKLPPYKLTAIPGCYYDGEWQKGRPHGAGKIYGINGIYYEGAFEQGMACFNEGIFIYPDGSYYKGSFRDNTFHGPGKFTFRPNNTSYSGDWREDKPNGKGLETYPDGSKYEGDFKDGKKHGEGKFTWADGKIYKGNFSEGLFEGNGKMFMKGLKSQFEGEFRKGLKVSGRLVTDYGVYEGKFQNGLMHDSSAVFKWFDGKVFHGSFEFGEMHGQGIISCNSGQRIFGEWQRGKNVKVVRMESCSNK